LGARSLPPAIILNGRLPSGGFSSSLFAGAIEGARGVLFGPQGFGGGKITLTGDNTFTGGSTILRNQTVQLGDGGATGSLVGNVFFTSTIGPISPTLGLLAFDRSDTYAFAGKISGRGDVEQIGSGALVLTADNTYTGTTTVSAGTLIVDGSIVSSSLTLDSGATLGGSGVVGGFAAPAGATVAPGALTPFSTLHVAGGVTFLPGSTYAVNIDAAGQTDAIAAAGKVKLSGGTVDVLAANGVYSPSTRYTILTASGGVSGTFAALTGASNLAFLTPMLSYDSRDVFLGFAPSAPFVSAAITPNEIATASAIQAQGSGPLFSAIQGQSAAGARAAFDALSGEIHPSAASAAFEDSRLPREAILDRLASPYGALPSGGATGFSAMNAIVAPSLPAQAFAAWGQAFGSFGHIGGDGNAATLDRSMGGFILGLDASLDQRYRIGVAAGYTQSTLSVDAVGSNGSVESTFGGLYGGASFNALQLRGGALYAYNRYGADRSVDFPGFSDTASSGYGGDTLQAFGEAGWRFGLSGFAGPTFVEPFVGALAMHIDTASFSEAGGASALTGASQGYDYGATTLGVRTQAALFGNSPLSARTMLGWQHVFGDVTPGSTLAFESAPSIPFAIPGAPVARDALVVEVGFDWRLSTNATAGVFYSGEIAARDEDNAIKGKFEIAF
jgi:outer membrane autotransporter protein